MEKTYVMVLIIYVQTLDHRQNLQLLMSMLHNKINAHQFKKRIFLINNFSVFFYHILFYFVYLRLLS